LAALDHHPAIWLLPDSPPQHLAPERRVLAGLPAIRAACPGRPTLDLVPASCVAAPLLLRSTTTLAGSVELAERVAEDRALAHIESGGFVLSAAGPKRRVGIRAPKAWESAQPDPETTTPPSLEERIRLALDDACAGPLASMPRGTGLWKTLERNCRSALHRFQQRREILSFSVRCDEETNLDQVEGVGVEVFVTTAKRVKEFRLVMSRF
ncbi:MAG: hypothetical protein KC561_21465, partial [Myxococcales bacterium]|nr:hypothetical protein [Myxococcales bacterium]